MKHPLLTAAASCMLAATLVLPAFAQSSASSSSTMKHAKAKATVDIACMASAVTARDTAISTALQTVVTAIQTRGQSLATAWGNTDPKARQTAVKAANTAFNGVWTTFNKARKSAWSQYATAAKACHGSSSDIQAPSSAAGSM